MTLQVRQAGEIEVRPPLRERARAHLVARRVAVVAVSRRQAWTVWQIARQLPGTGLLLLSYSPRGLGRLLAAWGRYARDDATAELRSYHATARETKEFKVAADERRAARSERALTSFTAVALAAGPILAWTVPGWCGVLAGVLVFVWTLKLIPGREIAEVAVGAGLGIVVGLAAWWWAPSLPVPPAWTLWLSGTLAVVGLGWVGRPREKPLVAMPEDGPMLPQKPTADMVIAALCRIGLPGMTMEPKVFERVQQETRIVAPGVATSAHGYVVELELPPGRTVGEVVGRREGLAGALRRDLGCVWPSGREDKHPGWLRLFLSHKPMNSGRQPAWPVAAGRRLDIFEPIPLFTDEEMAWVPLTIAGTHTAVGGASGFGKSVWLRQLTCAIAFDPRVKLIVIDGKRSGDFEHLRPIAHGFHVGAEPEEVEAQLDRLQGLVDECLSRAKRLESLPPEERSPKVTSELATRYPQWFAPIVLVYDEVQEGTEYGVKGEKEDKRIRERYTGLLTRLARIARSAGIFMVLASQKPSTDVIPSSIMGNCSIRIAFKVSEQTHNDQILGTSARRLGVDATMFTARDRGMAWLKGGDAAAAQVVRSWSAMVDPNLAVELIDKARALRRAAGTLPGDDIEDADVVLLDLRADVERSMAEHSTRRAHLTELVEWLREMRPDYATLTVAELGQRLRNARVTVSPQVWRNGRNATGVDLRKQGGDEEDEQL